VAGLIPESEYFSDDVPAEPERECEANFYAGTRRLIAGDESVARDFFARSVATGVEKLRQYQTAKRELEILDRKR
jgi:hypothetical protein